MSATHIVCVGGGPAGLYAALLLKRADGRRRISVIDRHPPGAAPGWGVVFSNETLDNLRDADPASAQAIFDGFHQWDDIEICFKGERVRSGGHGFAGIGRRRLLEILRQRCVELGVELITGRDANDADLAGADLIIAADGVNSGLRERHAASFGQTIEARRCRYAWLGTRQRFDAFTFAFAETEHGWFAAHGYQYEGAEGHQGGASTVIIETPDDVWRRAGLDAMPQAAALAYCEGLFAEQLGGHALLVNTPELRWHVFERVSCERWVHEHAGVPLVLLGDAAHSAHFSIGSGTKLALEDARELARCLDGDDLAGGLAAYQQARALEVRKLQNAARNSMEWFENVARYSALAPPQFTYALLTRSQRISHENLRLRDPEYVREYEAWLAQQACAVAGVPTSGPVPPMFTPFKARGVLLKNRIAVSPMAQYSASDGLVSDYHLMHLGARAMGGAALVFAEMTGVSADARITPCCPGLYRDEHTAAWARIVDFVHAGSDAKIAIQLGHAGPKGSTRVMWEGIDQPLQEGNWPLLAASTQQYLAGVSQVARAATLDDMARIEADFVAATRRAAQAGFDWLELHCAHGYLLSSFISALTNRRTDAYGGSLENRCRFPLRVLRAIRAAWPDERPISVRISAHDWVDGGTTPQDAVRIAQLLKAAGADMVACSSGQVSKLEQPVYGRMFQTPFADCVRNDGGIATIAVGSIEHADHANSIIAAGRADLCAVGRPHLANPAWTLHEAARIGFKAIDWPPQYRAAKAQLEKQSSN